MMRVKVSIMARRCSAYFPRARIQMNRVAPAASVPLRLADTLFPTLPIVQPARSPVAERNVSSAGRLSGMATDAAPEAPPFVTETLYWIASLGSTTSVGARGGGWVARYAPLPTVNARRMTGRAALASAVLAL